MLVRTHVILPSVEEVPTHTLADTSGDAPPSCGFRVCNVLTESHREDLLATIHELSDIDLEDPMFSLNRMKQGVHLYFRHISKEHAIFNHGIFVPHDEEKDDIRVYYGEEPPIQLTWAIITLGWSIRDNRTEHEMQVAATIQGLLRKFVLTASILLGNSKEESADLYLSSILLSL